MTCVLAIPVLRIWPLLWLAPLVIYFACVVIFPPLKASFRPWRMGRLSGRALLAALVIAASSCAVLIFFNVAVHPDVHTYGSFLPITAPMGILAIGVLFSFFNALFEEIIFRGVLFDSIESQWGDKVAVVVTALLFGYGHMRGYPPGAFGAVLAGIYGLCLGWLRIFSGGLGLPVLAHVVADATIFSIIVHPTR